VTGEPPVPGEPPPTSGKAPTEPTKIDVDRQAGVTITWADGLVARLGLIELRVNCPCAECRERRRAREPIWPRTGSPEPLRLLDAHLVGAFGIGFDWNDGHGTGIYTWDALRRWSDEERDD
jgi:ATP-binding protein involved in chromosome partitioning